MTAIENENLTSLNERVNLISEDLKEIKTALLGDAYNRNGIMNRLETLETELGEIKQDHVTLKNHKEQADFKKNWVFAALALLVSIIVNISKIMNFFKSK
jgi:hypothetical protein